MPAPAHRRSDLPARPLGALVVLVVAAQLLALALVAWRPDGGRPSAPLAAELLAATAEPVPSGPPIPRAPAAVATAVELPEAPPPVEHPVLEAALNGILEDAPAGSVVALSVSDESGAPVHEHAGDHALIPASTAKSVVAAAALRRLGPDHRYRTEVRATSPVGDDGVLDGALVLIGSGDPTLVTAEYLSVVPERPHTPLAMLADAIVASGVTAVTGGVLGDPGVFATEPDDSRGYGSHISGLTVDAGRTMLTGAGGLGSEVSTDPAARAADALHLLLVERGVLVGGPIGRAEGPTAAPTALASVESPPLVDVLRYMVQQSDNHLADAVFRTLGAIDGDGGIDASSRAVREALAGLPLRWDGVRLADGSGLSRRNRVTPRFLTDLEAAMWSTPQAETWGSLMAVTGERGTLARRMIGTPAAGKVLAKTGTLTGVRALSGSIVGADGARYHFAVIGNDLPGDAAGQLLELQDRVAITLADDLDGA